MNLDMQAASEVSCAGQGDGAFQGDFLALRPVDDVKIIRESAVVAIGTVNIPKGFRKRTCPDLVISLRQI